MNNESLQWIALGVLTVWVLALSICHAAQAHMLNLWWWDFLKDIKKEWKKLQRE